MQSLWTRATQLACTCRCPSCLHQKASVARRVSTIAGRLASRPFSTGTFLYSAIFAAACAVDGGAKAQRRKQWDDAISKAKHEIQSIEENTKEIAGGILGSLDGASKELQDEVESVRLTVDDVLTWQPGVLAQRPPPPISTVDNPHPEHLPPQSLWSGPVRRKKASEIDWTKKKIQMTELAVARLVLHMLLAVDMDAKSGAELEALPESVRPFASLSRKNQRDAAEAIRREVYDYVCHLKAWERGTFNKLPVPIPKYFQPRTERGERQATRLTNTLWWRFKNLDKRRVDIQALIISICDSLLTCPVPPSLQAYNTLLVGFLDLRSVNARFIILDALINLCREAHYRPNEFTCAGILRAYRSQNNPEKFAKFVSLMRAKDNALMLARPDISISEASRGRCVRKGKKVLQAVHPSPMVYKEMVLGVLKFVGFEPAIKIIQNLQQESWGLDWSCLRLLLINCVMRRAWEDGMMIWQQVEMLAQKADEQVPTALHAVKLALCKICDRLEEFNEQFEKALKEGKTAAVLLQRATREVVNAQRRLYEEDSADESATELQIQDAASLQETAQEVLEQTAQEQILEEDEDILDQTRSEPIPIPIDEGAEITPWKPPDDFQDSPMHAEDRLVAVSAC